MGRRDGDRARRPSRSTAGRLFTRRNVLLGIGATGLGGTIISSDAYSTTQATRTSSVATASDANALLGVSGIDAADQKPAFTNNAAGAMTVTLESSQAVEFDVGGLGDWRTPPVTFSLGAGASRIVAVRGSVNPATVTVTAAITENGRSVTTVTMERAFVIPQAGGVIDVAGSAKSSGRSGKYSFALVNNGTKAATMVAVGINGTTNPAATRVSAGSILSVDGTSVVSEPIPIDSSELRMATRVELDQAVTLAVGETKSLQFDKFRTAGKPPNADMRGQDVKLTLYFEDGSAITSNLCLDGCQF